jgi:dTDP-4-dehydrorhamnose reductase
MRVLLTGGQGFLGSHVARGCPDWEIYTTSRRAGDAPRALCLDVTDREAVEETLERLRPVAVIHAAALTRPQACAQDPAEAVRVNVEGTAHVARAAARVGARLVFLSSDLVFAGGEKRYDEDATPSPTTAYGRTKAAAERAARAACPGVSILRLSKLYGWGGSSGPAWLEAIRDRLAASEPVEAYRDWRRQFLYVGDAVELLRRLLERAPGAEGEVLHLRGPELLSSYEVARWVARLFGYPEGRVHPVERPRDEAASGVPDLIRLDGERVRHVYGLDPVDMRTGLARMRAETRGAGDLAATALAGVRA